MIKGNFLRIACSTLYLRDFIPKAKKLLESMKQQGCKHATKGISLQKIIIPHPKSFQNFSIGRFFKSVSVIFM